MGCYPLFACDNWRALEHDVKELEGELVSLALVTDPFGDFDRTGLQRCFRDRVQPFKQHFVVDLSAPEAHIAAHHRRNTRKALAQVDVKQCPDPALLLDEWLKLYANLISRHGIRGIAAFSTQTFARQLTVPGIVAFRADRHGETMGMTLWYTHRDVAYYHLGAYSERGYETGASFALFSTAIRQFAERGLHWLDLGAGPGFDRGDNDGLSRFKRGWSTGVRTAYFCGRVLARERYTKATNARGGPKTAYFPAYRCGEFA